MKPISRPRMLSARSQGTPLPIPAVGSAAKCSGKSQVKCLGWNDMYRGMDQNLHTTVSWKAVVCGSVLRLVHSLLPGTKYFWLKPLKYFRQQLEFAEHRDMILSGIYLFNETWRAMAAC